MKKGKWSPILEMLFAYLAVSKILYWINNISQIAQSDFDNAGQLVLNRLMSQDLALILCVIFFYFLDRLEIKLILKYLISYVIFITIVSSNIWLVDRFLIAEQGSLLAQFTFMGFFINFTVIYVIIAIIMCIKDYLKNKEKEIS